MREEMGNADAEVLHSQRVVGWEMSEKGSEREY